MSAEVVPYSPNDLTLLLSERSLTETLQVDPHDRPRLRESGIPEELFESFSTR